MDAQNFWFSSGAAGGGGDQGDPIGESLRFRGTAHLSNATISCPTTFTYSGWVKLADFTAGEWVTLFNQNNDPNGGNGPSFGTNSNDTIRYYSNSGSILTSTARFRDPSAWYNVVLQQTATNFTVWVNDQQVLQSNRALGANSGNFEIHRSFGGTNLAERDCYMADVYFIDGQALLPTAFGRTNDDGVWVPVDPEFDTADYGTNGFHLDFADPDNVGLDTSGNGNDFTATGFDTAPVGIFSNQLVSSSGTWAAGRTPIQLFGDTNTATMAQVGATGATMTFTPTTPINYQSLHYFNHGATWNLNSGTTGGTAGSAGWQEIDGNPGTLTSLQFLNTAGGAAAVGAIAINGTAAANILVDNTGEDYDSMQDSPTQNYSTWNSITPPGAGADVDPSDANLTLRGATGITIGEKPPGETIYFELQTGFVSNGGQWGNWWNEILILNGQTQAIAGGGNNVAPANILNQGGFAFDISANIFANNVDEAVAISNVNLAANDIIGVQIDDNNITIFINGVASSGVNNRAFANDFDDGMYIYGRNASTAGNPAEFMHINFGQRPYVARPAALNDNNNLQTQNLPTPTIANPANHFDVVLWDGNGVDNRNITGLEFQPCLVWIKNRNATNLNYLVTDSRMGSNRRVICNAPNGNNAMVTTNDFDTFNADGFTIGDGAEVNSNTAPNEYVAWCWFADNFNTNNNDGDIQTSIRTDVTGGFSCIQFTGDSAEDTIGHGLNAIPEFAIAKCLGVGNTAWQIYHHDLGVGSFLNFNTSAMTNTANFWGNQADWNTTTCGTSTANADHNRNNELMRWYVWHGVEGYSRFGSYTGNGNANGSFVYTGFTPRMILIRAAQTGPNGEESWFCYDTAREPNNVMNEGLEWNTQNREGAQPRDIDILSNGFKLRSAANQTNGNGTNYIYAAWAQMPFGGEDTAPATAR